MPDASLLPIVIIILLAIGFAFVNGTNDTANAIATVVGTRVMSPRQAVLMAAAANLVGATTGVAVARTIGKGILVPEAITYTTVIAGLIAVIAWTSLATWRGLPVSLTHGMVSSLAMAGVGVAGAAAVNWAVLGKVVAAIIIAPAIGFAGGYLMMVAIMWLFSKSRPDRVGRIFSNAQILSASYMAFSHGRNDGQMPIGLITMAMVIYSGNLALWDSIPVWIILVAAGSISAGTAIGGWRVVKTLGVRMTALKPVNGFAAETAAATVIQIASTIGIPVSTTHTISASIMGVGATRRLSAVRWGVAGHIFAAWVLTIPICGVIAFILATTLKAVF
ncbi:inorganic phosphate transporter [Dehalogenimonas alkenigignens]|uniref:inorganic phosphate transporter n=1 Tax=Dehalogenimonas alkenigignens TaxID=1217799 RepID=UPI000D57C210|nr:inorganic phosphate transporter [Dehalogenimonas alkenigignens]PVV83991.1 anion permease [Dehalogenimonas alkenigignens]